VEQGREARPLFSESRSKPRQKFYAGEQGGLGARGLESHEAAGVALAERLDDTAVIRKNTRYRTLWTWTTRPMARLAQERRPGFIAM